MRHARPDYDRIQDPDALPPAAAPAENRPLSDRTRGMAAYVRSIGGEDAEMTAKSLDECAAEIDRLTHCLDRARRTLESIAPLGDESVKGFATAAVADIGWVLAGGTEPDAPARLPALDALLAFRPQIASMEMGPEPALSDMARLYYSGRIDDPEYAAQCHREYMAAIQGVEAAIAAAPRWIRTDDFRGEPNTSPLAWWDSSNGRIQLDEVLIGKDGTIEGKGSCGASSCSHIMLMRDGDLPTPPAGAKVNCQGGEG